MGNAGNAPTSNVPYIGGKGLGTMGPISGLQSLGKTGPPVDGLGGVVVSSAAEQTSVIVSEWPAGIADLRSNFSRFGTITSCDADAASGSARVTFEAARSANHAVDMMNGMAVGDKTLHVSLGF